MVRSLWRNIPYELSHISLAMTYFSPSIALRGRIIPLDPLTVENTTTLKLDEAE